MEERQELGALDAELAARASVEAAFRLRLGQALEVLGRGGYCELGFSSMAAYAVERCERSVRWVEGARCLARRLEALPSLRRAVALGLVSWSMGELLARVASPQNEARWIEVARSRTVRQMRLLIRDTVSPERGAETLAASESEAEDMCTLTCTVNQEEAWLFEATRTLLEHLGVRGADAQVEALLAEAQGTLLAALPEGALDSERWESVDRAVQCWREQLDRWRAEAEALCEGRFRKAGLGGGLGFGGRLGSGGAAPGAMAVSAALGFGALENATGRELDGVVRGLAQALARHELEGARLVLAFHRSEREGGGWRKLGYASEGQYARERLGMSRSSLLARRALGLRLEALPRVAEALGAGHIGVEAALQLVRVAVPATEVAWVRRAQQRTIKHLREEVAAALTAVRLSGEADCPPPADAEMEVFHTLERAVVSGRACQKRSANGTAPAADPALTRGADLADVANFADVAGFADLARQSDSFSEGRRAWFVMLGSLARWLQVGVQTSADGATPLAGTRSPGTGSGAGQVVFRLRVSRATHAWWRGLAAQARRWLPRGMSWLKFLCMSLWQAWRHLVGSHIGGDVAYGQIYIRDRFRCTSPVCNRQDVTPHHLQFRSAGGSDEDDNVAAVCTWCHLFGVHGGRIRAVGAARCIRWELGPPGHPCLVVQGRQRMAA